MTTTGSSPTATATPFNVATPPWLDTGDNAWQLTAASLVGLQSVPGLVIMYAGLMKRKWAINSAFMAFYAFAMTLLCWVIWVYNEAFGHQMLPFVGKPGPVLNMNDELQQAVLFTSGFAADFPMSTMIYFQFVFAAITLVITAGAFLGRMNFLAWALYVPLWLTFSYGVGAFSLWGGGFLAKMGVIDYSGGYVIHVSSGTAGWIGSYWIGPRLSKDRLDNRPNNVLAALTGAGILWIGWNGFNGGDPYAASTDAGAAVLNTNLTTACSLLTWVLCDVVYFKKPSVIGAIQGMITGLVAITPAAGVISGWAAIIMGICSGSIPWLTMNLLARNNRFLHHFDDTLGVFHTHLVAGFVGGFLTGIFATIEGNAAFGLTTAGGAIYDNGRQVWLQIVGFLFIFGWNMVWTSLIMCFIKYVCRIPLRMSEEQLLAGDELVHGEAAYVFDELEGDPASLDGMPGNGNDLESGVDATKETDGISPVV